MSSTIFASEKRKRRGAEKNDNSDVEDDFADESDANQDGEGSDSKEPDGANEDDGSETMDDFQSKAFDISRTVNLESGDLADMLSEMDSPVQKKAVAKKAPAPAAAPKVLSEEGWEM